MRFSFYLLSDEIKEWGGRMSQNALVSRKPVLLEDGRLSHSSVILPCAGVELPLWVFIEGTHVNAGQEGTSATQACPHCSSLLWNVSCSCLTSFMDMGQRGPPGCLKTRSEPLC